MFKINKTLLACLSSHPIVNQVSRACRSQIKNKKNRFQVSINVRNYRKEEVCVKVYPEYVLIEGKQCRNTTQGCMTRQFMKKFQLPPGCDHACAHTMLSNDEILSVTVPKFAGYNKQARNDTLLPKCLEITTEGSPVNGGSQQPIPGFPPAGITHQPGQGGQPT